MKPIGVAFLLFTLAACEKQPAADENESASPAVPKSTNVRPAAPTPAPSAAPGDWRLKNYKPALDQRPGDKKHK